MTTQQIYNLAVQMGIKADLRGQAKVKKYLERAKKKYEKMRKEEKKEFDQEKLTNPYSDTRVLVDNKKKNIKKILTGIDIGGSELLLADKMGDVDLVISHHPAGKALNDLHSVMDMQAEIFEDWGVPINIAESLLRRRMEKVNRRLSPHNSNRAVDVAEILKMDLICTHTVCDNLAASYMTNYIKRKKPLYIDELIEAIKSVPEYSQAGKLNDGPNIFYGHKNNRCGKIVVDYTGGTSPSKAIYEKLSQAGIGTVVGMHIGEESLEEAKKYHLNVVIAGHMASDSLGMNLFLDQLEKKGIKVVPCSGLIRIKRFK